MAFITDNPVGFALAIFVWVPVAIWIQGTLNLAIMAEVDFLFFVMSSFMMVAVGYFTATAPTPGIAWLFFSIAWGQVVLAHPIRTTVRKIELSKIDYDQADKLMDQIGRTLSLVSVVRLGEILRQYGLPGHAVAILDRGLQGKPKQMYASEYQTLASWKRQPLAHQDMRPLACDRCNELNPPGEIFCRRCNNKFLLAFIRATVLQGRTEFKLLIAWTVLVAVSVLVLLSRRFLPTWAFIPLALILIAVGVVVVMKALMRGRR
ncbi:MAG: hypothetical protein JST40_10880 [Armatimonadetes bacterium]|nr:hypothetical protein [Armatimonadota bacterium]